MTQERTEPNWKQIAYELASIIDDIQLQFDIDMEDANSRLVAGTSRNKFMFKKFIAAQKYFVRYKNEILYIDDFKERLDKDKNLAASLIQSFKK